MKCRESSQGSDGAAAASSTASSAQSRRPRGRRGAPGRTRAQGLAAGGLPRAAPRPRPGRPAPYARVPGRGRPVAPLQPQDELRPPPRTRVARPARSPARPSVLAALTPASAPNGRRRRPQLTSPAAAVAAATASERDLARFYPPRRSPALRRRGARGPRPGTGSARSPAAAPRLGSGLAVLATPRPGPCNHPAHLRDREGLKPRCGSAAWLSPGRRCACAGARPAPRNGQPLPRL